MLKSLVSDAVVWETDDGYPAFESLIASRLRTAAAPILTTAIDTAGLFDAFLNHLPPDRRQHYNCSACRKFVERFGHLVIVDDDGAAATVLWEPAGVPVFFAESVAAVRREVLKGKVGGVFLSEDSVLGTPAAGGWSHFHGPNAAPYKATTLTASQAAAAKAEDYGVLCRSLADFSVEAAAEAVRVLEADALDRSEKTLGVAKWFHALRSAWTGGRKNNLVWRAVATAPPGWCHVRSSMIGTLLEDLAAGLGYEAVKARWAAKMHPLQYQRPTALKAGNLERAEKLVKELGAETALQRRFATLADVTAIWRPVAGVEVPPSSGSVFGHLRAKAEPAVSKLTLPAKTLTWEKFARDVLPGTAKIELSAPGRGSYFGLVTAAHADAKPILQWDTDPRNPVSWYFYHGGSSAGQWGLAAGAWVPVTAVMLKPPQWHHPERFAHHGESVFLALEGAKDTRKAGGTDAGGGMFPESLKSEYHEIRAAVEAYTLAAVLGGYEGGNANGYALDKGGTWNCRLRVTGPAGVSEYTLDRWE